MSEPLADGTTAVVPLLAVSGVVKRSVSLPTELYEAIERQAAIDGTSVSAVIAAAAKRYVVIEEGLRDVELWMQENGPFTDEEVAAADRWVEEAFAKAEAELRRPWTD